MLYNQHLRMFLSVAECGSFSKAAEKNFISTSAVIKQIKLLEDNMHVKLFERKSRGIELTAAGLYLFENTEKIIVLCDSIEKITLEEQQNGEKLIRIGSSAMTYAAVFAPYIEKIRKIDKSLKFQIVNFENDSNNNSLLKNHVSKGQDIVVCAYSEEMLEALECDALELYKEKFNISVPLSNSLSEKEKITLNDLRGEELILMNPQRIYICGDIYKYLQNEYPQIKVGFTDFYNFDFFENCYYNSQLILTVPSWKNVHPFFKQKNVDWDFETSVGIVYGKSPNGKVRELLNVMKNIVN